MGPWRRFVDNFSSKLAFFPPTPPTYKLVPKDGTEDLHVQIAGSHGGFTSRHELRFKYSVKQIRTRPTNPGGHGAAQTIVAVHIPYTGNAIPTSGPRITMICSHGNAVDVAQMMPMYRELSHLLKVDVVGYDYTGYGQSSGQPTASQTMSDIQAVFAWVHEDLGVPPANIILYGQSVGSGPTSWLAAHEKAVGGVVLHSPIMSGVRVLNPTLNWWPAWADVFPNHTLVPKIHAPVLIMHGTEDEVIHISCGRRLHELVKNKYPALWAEGYNHQNVESCPLYLPTLEDFVSHVRMKAHAFMNGR